MSTDEANKQYFKFALIISVIISLLLNYSIIGSLQGPFVSGFPINVYEVGFFAGIFFRFFNSIIFTALIVVPVYYGVQWLLKKTSGY